MAAILVPKGRIVLTVRAFQSLYGPIDERLGHHRRYGKRELASLASRIGLRVVTLHYLNFAGFVGWWINAKILARQAQSISQILVFDRLIVPVVSRLESLVRPPFGQSIFAVLEKCR